MPELLSNFLRNSLDKTVIYLSTYVIRYLSTYGVRPSGGRLRSLSGGELGARSGGAGGLQHRAACRHSAICPRSVRLHGTEI